MSRKILRVLSLIFILNIIFFSGKLYALTPQDNLKYEGIDVSRYQGIIDFSKVKDAGIGIVYIKASQGTNYVDSNFELNYNQIKQIILLQILYLINHYHIFLKSQL